MTNDIEEREPDATEMEEQDAEAAPPLAGEITSEEKVRIMAAAADSVRASDIVVLDLRDLTIITDFFLICTGNSSIQIRAIADRIEEKLRERGIRKSRIEGYQEATWILLDYGDVVAHVMAAEQRAFYNLEGFWANAPRLELNLRPEMEIAVHTHPPGRFEAR
ncbi:MAG TPA: ribosome silencing factor [Chthonomonadaceae bacterium]|nr:ribosome silencing factor [Chthonomonadaceae bacterium]